MYILKNYDYNNILHFKLEQLDDNIKLLHKLQLTSHNMLLIQFYGSSPDNSLGISSPQLLDQMYRQAGALPIFLSFKPNILKIMKTNMNKIYQDIRFKYLFVQLLRFGIAKLCQRKTDRGKLLLLPPASEILSTLEATEAEVIHLRREPYSYLNFTRLPPGEILRQIERDQLHNLLRSDQKPEISNTILHQTERVLKIVFERIADNRDHGLYTTIVEEIIREFYYEIISRSSWEKFKETLESSFKTERSTTGGNLLCWLVEKICSIEPSPRIILVGHGIGANCLCYLLQNLNKMYINKQIIFDLILLAPACSFQLFVRSVLPQETRIGKLLLFGLPDSFERVDAFSGAIYTRSLLYFISGLLEGEIDQPLLGMQRFYREILFHDAKLFPEINQMRQFIDKHQGHLIWSRTVEKAEFSSQAKYHEDFLQDRQTIDSICRFIG